MQVEQLEQRMEELELRVDGIEQILPTLATRDELHAAISASEHRIRTHFDVVAESLRNDIRLVAEAVAALSERVR
jgi:uncharacterized coiled-coil protein SlyX